MADHFTYRVSWSEEDGEYVGICAEFPSLSHLDADQDGALRGIRKLVADVVADMRANGEAVPEPLTERTYSGKFQTRTARVTSDVVDRGGRGACEFEPACEPSTGHPRRGDVRLSGEGASPPLDLAAPSLGGACWDSASPILAGPSPPRS